MLRPLALSRASMPSNEVVSHRPKDHGGGKAGLPVSRVKRSSTSFGVGPSMIRYSSDSPSTEKPTFDTNSEPTSKDTLSGWLTSTPQPRLVTRKGMFL